jgi:hypothetical protein
MHLSDNYDPAVRRAFYLTIKLTQIGVVLLVLHRRRRKARNQRTLTSNSESVPGSLGD